jgi:hypothetical protein
MAAATGIPSDAEAAAGADDHYCWAVEDLTGLVNVSDRVGSAVCTVALAATVASLLYGFYALASSWPRL